MSQSGKELDKFSTVTVKLVLKESKRGFSIRALCKEDRAILDYFYDTRQPTDFYNTMDKELDNLVPWIGAPEYQTSGHGFKA